MGIRSRRLPRNERQITTSGTLRLHADMHAYATQSPFVATDFDGSGSAHGFVIRLPIQIPNPHCRSNQSFRGMQLPRTSSFTEHPLA
ncbi:hypothetical protein PHSY_002201 [Pseudozyma hubeiensis SY62]|uniref:Uncharacterized protein n=1 Tax=Pseudozyma hubeiensis (strain SY62) TaxID=1305764 RepID=R9P0A9_PSEHS|nr:hypothetical protein PHSY_002201 [Pseudozyma hubeiensis SY62]GAC94628.1 hypothetical protein PHSY_002201 [Pseudozyma hubeiensis SY62]